MCILRNGHHETSAAESSTSLHDNAGSKIKNIGTYSSTFSIISQGLAENLYPSDAAIRIIVS